MGSYFNTRLIPKKGRRLLRIYNGISGKIETDRTIINGSEFLSIGVNEEKQQQQQQQLIELKSVYVYVINMGNDDVNKHISAAFRIKFNGVNQYIIKLC